jgi:hypothetical protein
MRAWTVVDRARGVHFEPSTPGDGRNDWAIGGRAPESLLTHDIEPMLVMPA